MGRGPCCSKEGMNKGAWTAIEDELLVEYIKVHGEGKWSGIPKKAGLKRCGKSCRLRWLNYLRPDIKRGNITHDEEELIIRLHKLLGNRWSLIAGRLPGRTDNEIKNYWNTNIGKKISSTPNHRPRIQSEERPNSTSISPRPSLNNGPPPVLHAKPSRCTKVFIATEPPKVDQVIETRPVSLGPSTVQGLAMAHDQKAEEPDSSPAIGSGNENDSNPSDFMIDFEMDANFLSEFLNSDFSQLCDFHDGVEADSNTNTSSTSQHSSPNATEAPLLMNEEETLQNSNLFSLDSFLDCEMDWFC